MKHTIQISSNASISLSYTPGQGGNSSSIGMKYTDAEAVADGVEESLAEYNAAIDGLEHLILAQACEGIDITSEAYRRAVITAFNAICDQFG